MSITDFLFAHTYFDCFLRPFNYIMYLIPIKHLEYLLHKDQAQSFSIRNSYLRNSDVIQAANVGTYVIVFKFSCSYLQRLMSAEFLMKSSRIF